MLAVYQAVTRIGPSGPAPLPWMETQRITVAEALRLLTIDAAWGTNEDNVHGSLSQGKLADLVVLSHNPLDVTVDLIPEINHHDDHGRRSDLALPVALLRLCAALDGLRIQPFASAPATTPVPRCS